MLKHDFLRATCLGLAGLLAVFFTLHAQAVDFHAGDYTPYSSDYNQDGVLDVLLEPQTKFAIIPMSDLSDVTYSDART